MMSMVTRLVGKYEESSTDDDIEEPMVDAPIDEVTEVLSCERRRWVIGYLADHEATTLGDLADARAADEYGEGYNSTQRKREYIGYYQQHLPTLDDARVVNYAGGGQAGHAVTRGPNYEGYLDVMETLYRVCTVEVEQ